jgi:hypothetical protein
VGGESAIEIPWNTTSTEGFFDSILVATARNFTDLFLLYEESPKLNPFDKISSNYTVTKTYYESYQGSIPHYKAGKIIDWLPLKNKYIEIVIRRETKTYTIYCNSLAL